jgi:tRNA(fMet)-specific endonuclease VapC
MTARYLLDTNICIYIQRNKPENVLARFEKLKPGEAAISVVTWGELMYGAEKSQYRQKVMALLDEFTLFVPVLPMSGHVGKAYGDIRKTLESQGTPIGNNDLWIAAHAMTENLVLVTNNEKEFKRIPHITLENWAD